MAIHVQDAEADRLVREFARRRGIGLTDAIKTAVREASASEKRSVDETLRTLEPLLVEVRRRRRGGFDEAQTAIDDMWNE